MDIKKIVTDYIKAENTDYAIMVTGVWGSGKTFFWIFDTPIHMAFRGQVNNPVHLFFLHQFQYTLKIADIHLDKLVVGLVLYP